MDDPAPSELTFAGFVLSLATTAAVHFGDIDDPATGRRSQPDLDAAARVIELLAMLQDKTKGNLGQEEEQLLGDLLYELRLRFVEAKEGEKRIIEP